MSAGGTTVAYACDHEPFSKPEEVASREFNLRDQRHVEFLTGADLVIHDSQYTAAEYPQKIGWGHSTMEYGMDVCRAAGAKRLAFTHHDPLPCARRNTTRPRRSKSSPRPMAWSSKSPPRTLSKLSPLRPRPLPWPATWTAS